MREKSLMCLMYTIGDNGKQVQRHFRKNETSVENAMDYSNSLRAIFPAFTELLARKNNRVLQYEALNLRGLKIC